MAIVANGFAADSNGYWFIQQGIAQFTRTCTYDTRGAGWTMWPGNPPVFGFEADASDMKLILDQELSSAGVPAGEANVIIAGHSNGWLTASSFRAAYAADYRRIVIARLDGQSCTGVGVDASFEDDITATIGFELPEGTARYVIAPIMPFIGGGLVRSLNLLHHLLHC